LRRGGAGLAAGALVAASIPRAAAQEATPVATEPAPLPDGITAIIEGSRYAFSRWGIHVADRASGEAVYDQNRNQRFLKLIVKVSHRQHADLLIFLLALKHGEASFEAGMTLIRPFLEKIGLDPAEVSLGDGRGNEHTDLFSPRTVSALLRAMATRPEFPIYHGALPILGVDDSGIERYRRRARSRARRSPSPARSWPAT
jgi:D-alanyl-D-alanine carboxypeptidase